MARKMAGASRMRNSDAASHRSCPDLLQGGKRAGNPAKRQVPCSEMHVHRLLNWRMANRQRQERDSPPSRISPRPHQLQESQTSRTCFLSSYLASPPEYHSIRPKKPSPDVELARLHRLPVFAGSARPQHKSDARQPAGCGLAICHHRSAPWPGI